MLPTKLPLALLLLLFPTLISAQFNIFDQFFGRQNQPQAHYGNPQPGSTQSLWQAQADAGTSSLPSPPLSLPTPTPAPFPRSGIPRFRNQANDPTVPCASYLCPTTLLCTPTPADCPCPSPQDIKCLVPDHQTGENTVVCVRGGEGCENVLSLGRAI
ncbi:hypothetical protein DACRYDRAFT_103287 [Dacryopinax primogenitus]|uniref:Long chronological lifespan protein 2 n=1 Tax=Dacryopinax primogenitus (strain DJM 731) TaxID=1858805 RepID=M5G804_DACPD|nr:uncharacterized protein DACRYDRAFT_103287 [Dacryopinax primogenitus]EJU06341.1 hypothetical protein DACRYDRAFT_103287 [Dacryopinax primogenitus]